MVQAVARIALFHLDPCGENYHLPVECGAADTHRARVRSSVGSGRAAPTAARRGAVSGASLQMCVSFDNNLPTRRFFAPSLPRARYVLDRSDADAAPAGEERTYRGFVRWLSSKLVGCRARGSAPWLASAALGTGRLPPLARRQMPRRPITASAAPSFRRSPTRRRPCRCRSRSPRKSAAPAGRRKAGAA
jgi:hypothetical protein